MTLFARFASLFRRAPVTAEDLAAEAEATRIRDQIETARLSQRSPAGESYQSGRSSTYR